MIKEILWGNFEGLIIAGSFFVLFSKILNIRKIKNEKPLTSKRIFYSFVGVAYYFFVYHIFLTKGLDPYVGKHGLDYFIILVYLSFSLYFFGLRPMLN